jgi:hypothetical protein
MFPSFLARSTVFNVHVQYRTSTEYNKRQTLPTLRPPQRRKLPSPFLSTSKRGRCRVEDSFSLGQPDEGNTDSHPPVNVLPTRLTHFPSSCPPIFPSDGIPTYTQPSNHIRFPHKSPKSPTPSSRTTGRSILANNDHPHPPLGSIQMPSHPTQAFLQAAASAHQSSYLTSSRVLSCLVSPHLTTMYIRCVGASKERLANPWFTSHPVLFLTLYPWRSPCIIISHNLQLVICYKIFTETQIFLTPPYRHITHPIPAIQNAACSNAPPSWQCIASAKNFGTSSYPYHHIVCYAFEILHLHLLASQPAEEGTLQASMLHQQP